MRIDTDVLLLKYRRTKIVATLGPASSDPGMIERLMESGVDVFRLNMSHGNHAAHREAFVAIRNASEKMGRPVGILADLCGPKIRVGSFQNGFIHLKTGQRVLVTTRDVEGDDGLIPSRYRDLHADIHAGACILLDDGNLELRVEGVDGPDMDCTVVHGGRLQDHKGMNLPNVRVSAPSFTETDREDALFALDMGVDFLALSFVRQGSDLRPLRDLISETGSNASIISKIEKPEALENIDEIMQESDAIMVARGDLGVELPPQKVPHAQDRLIDLARHYRIPVIVATQMLESMIEHPRPTRA
jgi:pyruvate kinase